MPALSLQALDAFGMGIDLAQRGECRCGVGRGYPDRVDEAGGRILQVLDERVASADIAAATCKRLAQGAHPNIHVAASDAVILPYAASGFADHSDAVRLVHEKDRLMASSSPR